MRRGKKAILAIENPSPPSASVLVGDAIEVAREVIAANLSRDASYFSSAVLWYAEQFQKHAQDGDWKEAAGAAYMVGRCAGQAFLHIKRTEPGRKGPAKRYKGKADARRLLREWVEIQYQANPGLQKKEAFGDLPPDLGRNFNSYSAFLRAIKGTAFDGARRRAGK